MKARNSSLDVLRGVAVLLVICCHYVITPVMRAGWMGVDLFFVLSGFLISGLLFKDILRRDSIDIRRFYIRRGFKIYPAFYFFLLLTLPLILARGSSHVFAAPLFLQNYFIIWPPQGVWSHTWSLAVEEHFYIALPLILAALHRYRLLRLVPIISIFLFVACIAMRASLKLPPSYGQLEAALYPTHLRVDGLFAGVALGYFWHFKKEEFLSASRPWLPVLALMVLTPTLVIGKATLFGVSFNTVGFALLLIWAYPRTWIRSRWMEFIGRHSYSIYLWHLLVRNVFVRYLHDTPARWFAAYMLLSILLGVGAAKLIEFPALKLRERFFPSGRPSSSEERERPDRSRRSGIEEHAIASAGRS